MRCALAVLVVLVSLATPPVHAAQLTGQVVSVNPAQGRLMVMRFDQQAVVTVLIPASRWPANLQPGSHVSIEGSFSNQNHHHFVGRAISLGQPPPPAHRDPTGVRSRLNRLQ
jgi:hypothetical protein